MGARPVGGGGPGPDLPAGRAQGRDAGREREWDTGWDRDRDPVRERRRDRDEEELAGEGALGAVRVSRMPPREPADWRERLGWVALGALLLATLAATLFFNRSGRPSLVGDEATYAMQAASLAWDFDLAYTRADYDRFLAQWGGPPDGVILQSRDGGAHITYGKPFLYALAVAPFVRLSPLRGALVANALMLAAAAIAAARTLKLRLGGVAPLWTAVLVFASVSFAYVFWVHADLMLLAATAGGFAMAFGGDRSHRPAGMPLPRLYDGDQQTRERRVFARWLVAGVLLAVPGAFRPFYLVLLVPAALAVPRGRRRAGIAALGGLAAGAVCLLALTSFGQWAAGGGWNGYAGERRGFYAATGYPAVDFPAAGWSAALRHWGNTSWVQEGAFEPVWNRRLWGWNALYFLAGRDVGVLPYFLPLCLGFVAYRGDRGRWLLPWVVALAAACFLLVRPFNFYGGGGAIGNRYFLPLYPALWFLAGRPARASAALLAAGLAAPFLWPLWQHPAAYPIGADGRYRHVSAVAQALLPYETTQSHIPGGEDAAGHGLWVKLLNRGVTRTAAGALTVAGGERAELLVGSPEPLTGLELDFEPRAPSRLSVDGQELRPTLLRPDRSLSFDVPLGSPRAVHPMWWTKDDYYLYELAFRLPGAPAAPIGFKLRRERHTAPRDAIGAIGTRTAGSAAGRAAAEAAATGPVAKD